MWEWIAGLAVLWCGATSLALVLWSRFWQHQRALEAGAREYDRLHPTRIQASSWTSPPR